MSYKRPQKFIRGTASGDVSSALEGAVGEEGLRGIRGERGERGPPGPMGLQGPMGPRGLDGPQGETGADGSLYNLPIASSSTLGGVKIDGNNLSINSGTGILSATYSAAVADSVDQNNNQVPGSEGLMSAADKTKLDGIATGANAFVLPVAGANTLGGVKINGNNLSINSGTGVLSATYSAAVADSVDQNNNQVSGSEGLMSAADKTKLDGIATGANAFVLPVAGANTLGGVKINGNNLSIDASGVLSANFTSTNTFGTPSNVVGVMLSTSTPDQSGTVYNSNTEITFTTNINASITTGDAVLGANIPDGVTVSSIGTDTVGSNTVSKITLSEIVTTLTVGQFIGFGGEAGSLVLNEGVLASGTTLTQADIHHIHSLENLNYTAFYELYDAASLDNSNNEIGPYVPVSNWGNGAFFGVNTSNTTYSPSTQYLNTTIDNISIVQPITVASGATNGLSVRLSSNDYQGVYNIKFTLELSRDTESDERQLSIMAVYGNATGGFEQCPGRSIDSQMLFKSTASSESERTMLQLDLIQKFDVTTNLLVLQTFCMNNDTRRLKTFNSSSITDTISNSKLNILKVQLTVTYLGK